MTLDITESSQTANCLEHTVLDPNTVAGACSRGCHSTQLRGYSTLHYACSMWLLKCLWKEGKRQEGWGY